MSYSRAVRKGLRIDPRTKASRETNTFNAAQRRKAIAKRRNRK